MVFYFYFIFEYHILSRNINDPSVLRRPSKGLSSNVHERAPKDFLSIEKKIFQKFLSEEDLKKILSKTIEEKNVYTQAFKNSSLHRPKGLLSVEDLY